MFDIGWSELLVIGIVALIAIGPKELPGVLRTVGQFMGKIRRMASEFQDQFRDAMREAELADVKKQVDEMTSAATDFTNYDPMASVRKEFDDFGADKPAATAALPPIDTVTSAPAEAPPQPAATPAPDDKSSTAPQATPPNSGPPKSGEGA